MNSSPESSAATVAEVAAVLEKSAFPREKLLAAALPARPAGTTPWYITAVCAVFAWLIAEAALGGLMLLFRGFVPALGLLGAICYGWALWRYPRISGHGVFSQQLHLAILLIGDLLIMGAVGDWAWKSHHDNEGMLLLLLGITQTVLTALAYRPVASKFFHFCAVCASDTFLVGGIWQCAFAYWGSDWGNGDIVFGITAGAQLLLTVIIFRFYQNKLLRFAAVVGSNVWLCVWMAATFADNGQFKLKVAMGEFGIQILALALVLFIRPFKEWVLPLCWGLTAVAVGLAGMIELGAVAPKNEFVASFPWFAALGITAMFALLAGRWGGRRLLCRPAGIALLATVCAIGVGVSPGIALGLFLITAGYAYADWVLSLCGYVSLAWAVPLYYYSLKMPLDVKGLILCGCGAALLAGRYLLRAREGGK